jgi:hypothetical protein
VVTIDGDKSIMEASCGEVDDEVEEELDDEVEEELDDEVEEVALIA